MPRGGARRHDGGRARCSVADGPRAVRVLSGDGVGARERHEIRTRWSLRRSMDERAPGRGGSHDGAVTLTVAEHGALVQSRAQRLEVAGIDTC